MTPLVRDLIAAAVGFLPRDPAFARADRAARLSELRLLLAEARPAMLAWPAGAQALAEALQAVERGALPHLPAGLIGAACDDRWPTRADAWLRRADCGQGPDLPAFPEIRA